MDLQTIYGSMRVPPLEKDIIVRCLELFGEWSYNEVLLLSRLARRGDIFWDVGAFLGTFGLGFAQLVEIKQLVCVEANPFVYPYLQENLRRNCISPSIAVNAAVAAQAGTFAQEDKSITHIDNVGATRFSEYVGGRKEPVKGTTLRELREAHGDYNILKLDIEGMETEALLGDCDFIASRRPVLWIECNENLASIGLLKVVRALNYSVIYVGFPAFRRNNFHRNPEPMFPLAYEAALLAGPKDRLGDFPNLAQSLDCIVREVSNPDDLRQALWETPRWADAGWLQLSRPELIAMLGRSVLSQEKTTFLE